MLGLRQDASEQGRKPIALDNVHQPLLREFVMTESTPEPSRFNWILPVCAALVVVAVYLAMALWAMDAEFFASVLLIAPALILVSTSGEFLVDV